MGLIDSQVAIVTALVGVYSCWDMRIAWKLFHRTRNEDVVLCSVMVSACVRSNKEYFETLKLFNKMMLCGYSIKISIYCRTILWNSLLYMNSKCRDLEAALRFFKHMPNKDMVSRRIMIHGCVVNNRPKKTLKIFLELRAYSEKNIRHAKSNRSEYLFYHLKQKDLIAMSVMVAVYAQSTQPNNAFDMLRHMQSADQKPNEFTFVTLLLACTALDAIELGDSVHSQITPFRK
ncbi:hypothetical protein MIMGU_mgv11b021099mg [Erythranthe guttata]|uniref:Pentacotripeptide-repeat region of PRORP domain-containing protein n=1 Tax=Erythranthe guttata TaxID=4155 RepID=A0A022S1X4_ERYGU|nr:hypothetical protein MIMGU_mgv11b021099mg [Erythranthe guttata]